MVLCAAASFFNTAILLLLTQANTEHTVLGWLNLHGAYSELSADWYILIGDALVWTMLLNALTLYISCFTEMFTAALSRAWDKGFTNFIKMKMTY